MANRATGPRLARLQWGITNDAISGLDQFFGNESTANLRSANIAPDGINFASVVKESLNNAGAKELEDVSCAKSKR